MRLSVRPTARLLPLLAGVILVAACSDDVTAPPRKIEGTITVDARANWAYVSLEDSAVVTPAPSANESGSWDIAFFGTSVTLNGGAAGPGGITAACLCQNASATNEEVLAMTAASEKADFDAVKSVPAGLTFSSDVLTPAVSGWFTGTGSTAVAEPGKTFLVRLADSLSYAKVHVTQLASSSATSAGRVTLEYAVQPTAASAFEPTRTITVDLTTTGAKSVDLNAGAITTSSTDWDLRLEGFTIKVNGGVSGPGKAGAATAAGSFAATTTAVTSATAYRTDVYTGVFGTSRYYRYNILGDHKVSPTFDVYIIRRGASVYALQIVGYYSSTGVARYITFRYKKLPS